MEGNEFLKRSVNHIYLPSNNNYITVNKISSDHIHTSVEPMWDQDLEVENL